MITKLTVSLICLIGAVILSACSGIEAYQTIGLRRVDEHQASQATHDKPFCKLLGNCNEGAESHGS